MKKFLASLLVLVMAIALVPQGLFTIDVWANSNECTSDHTYDNSLDTACNTCGHTRTFDEFPIVGISAEMKPIIEKTGGYTSTDPNGNEWYRYMPTAATIALTMADGLTFSGANWEIYDLTGSYPQFSYFQNYTNPWGVGEHTVELWLGNITGEATVTIIENPIRAITAEPITVVEGTCGNSWSYESDGKLQAWFEYDIYNHKLTLDMKDGTTYTGSWDDIYATYGVSPSYSDDQSYDNPWGVGTHVITVSIGEATGTVPLIITESPIASISAAPISIYEDIYEYSRIIAGRGLGPQNAYYYYDEIIPIMVTYKNGTSITGTREEIYHATGIELACFDNQNSSPWEPGPHKATVSLGHLSCEVDITLAPNPVESIELVDIPKTEFADGEQFDLSGSVLRVHFHDGTSEDISIPNFNYMDSVYYYCNKLQAAGCLFTNINVNGEPVYSLSYLGKNTDEYSYSKTDHSIQSVSAVEENKNLFITITYDDNTLITLQALRFIPRMGDSCSCGNHAIMYGDLYTDKGVYFAGFIPGCDGSLCVEIDYVPSNALPDGSAWFNMYNDKYISSGGANFALLVILLDHYNGKITAENIDNIITYTGTFEDVALKDGGFFDGQSLREAIMKVFAVDSVDLSLSTLYDSKNDRYPATGFGGEAGIHFTPSLVYENGYWEMCYPTGTDHINSYIHYDDDGRILHFSYREPVVSYGDASGDSVIDSRDLVLIRKFMANFDYDTNTSTVEVAGGADTNGDGGIDARDLVLLRQYFANYDYDSGSSSVVLGPQN